MQSFIQNTTPGDPATESLHFRLCLFRMSVSIRLIIMQGFKKIGIGVEKAAFIPNKLQLPKNLKQYFYGIFFPVLFLLGLFTQLLALPLFAFTLTRHFLLHRNPALLVKDVPFIYCVVFLLILVPGVGKSSIDYFINKKQPR